MRQDKWGIILVISSYSWPAIVANFSLKTWDFVVFNDF
jgi:hypothetical protein